MENETIIYPIRINRYLYLKNICSRREADRYIEKKLILINGKEAQLGQKITQEDKVELKEKAKKQIKNKILIAFNKPLNVVSCNPQEGEKSINDFLNFSKKLSPIGRLDKNSCGLILVTNDGKLVDKMLNPNYFHEKQYLVKVDKKINGFFLKRIENGINIEGYITKKAKAKKIDSNTFSLILTEGKKHQIRRMCTALGFQVTFLQRVRFMNIKLGNLKIGEYKKIEGQEYLKLIDSLK